MEHPSLFGLIILFVIMVLITSTTSSGYSSTLENNTVHHQVQRSLEANQKQLASVSTQPVPNAVPSTFQEIHGTSMVQGVWFTGVIITNHNEVSVNLHTAVGSGATPPVNITATAQTKNADGKPVTMNGSMILNSGWASPYTLKIGMNGESTLYEATSINVVASPLGSSQSPSLPSIVPESNDNQITSSTVKPQGGQF